MAWYWLLKNKNLLKQIDQGELDADAKRRETSHGEKLGTGLGEGVIPEAAGKNKGGGLGSIVKNALDIGEEVGGGAWLLKKTGLAKKIPGISKLPGMSKILGLEKGAEAVETAGTAAKGVGWLSKMKGAFGLGTGAAEGAETPDRHQRRR